MGKFGEHWAVEKHRVYFPEGGFSLHRFGETGEQYASRIVACVNALAGIPDPAAFIADTHELLDRLETYFDQRSDVVDGDYGVPEPNAEMQHLTAVQSVLDKLWRGS